MATIAINETEIGGFSTATLYDGARRLGLDVGLRAVTPMSQNSRVVAPAYTVRFAPVDQAPKTTLNLYDIIASAPKGHVLVVEVGADRWICGANITRFAQLSGMAGMVMDGSVRDIAEVRTRGYPIFARGVSVTSYATGLVLSAVGTDIVCGDVQIAPGDIVVGDDDGVVSLPAVRLKDILYEAEEIDRLDAKLGSDIEARRPLADLHASRLQWAVRRTSPQSPG